MEKFIKQNWFKVTIIFLLSIVTVAMLYYWAIFLPNFNKGELNIKNQTTCSQMGEKVISKNYPNFIAGLMDINSEDHFNLNLNKCIVEINYSYGPNPLYTEDSLYDGIENKTLFDCVSTRHSDLSVTGGCYDHRSNENGTEISKATFDSLKSNYMNK